MNDPCKKAASVDRVIEMEVGGQSPDQAKVPHVVSNYVLDEEDLKRYLGGFVGMTGWLAFQQRFRGGCMHLRRGSRW